MPNAMNNQIMAMEYGYLQAKLSKLAKIDMTANMFAEDLILDYKSAKEAAVDAIYSVQGSTAHIDISGELSLNGPDFIERLFGFDGVGYGTIRDALARAEADSSVARIALEINSPGGSIAGVDQTWLAIRHARKPVVAYSNGMIASAAYYLASAADKIIARSITDNIGSIGVIAQVEDADGEFELYGGKRYTLVSQNAPAKSIKNAAFLEQIQALLDAHERQFYRRISEGRGVSTVDIAQLYGQGALLVASDPDPEKPSAIKNGMVDGLEQYKPQSIIESEDEEFVEDIPVVPDNNQPPPADEPVTNEKEEAYVNLAEFCKENNAAAKELERLRKQSFEAGATAVAEKNAAIMAKVKPVLEGYAYPPSVKTIAMKVLAGEMSLDMLSGAMAAIDTSMENLYSQAAIEESAGFNTLTGQYRPAGTKTMDGKLDAEELAIIQKVTGKKQNKE